MRLLCGAGASKDQPETGGATPIVIAAENGHEAVVQLLCEAGANEDQPETKGATPMVLAAFRGHEACSYCAG